MDARDWEPIYHRCTRFLRGHYPRSLRQVLEELAAYTDPSLTSDFYGSGDLIQGFGQEVADILFYRSFYSASTSSNSATTG